MDPIEDYLGLLKEVFDFQLLRNFIARPDFTLVFDALHAVTGAYAGPILVDALGADPSSIRWGSHTHLHSCCSCEGRTEWLDVQDCC